MENLSHTIYQVIVYVPESHLEQVKSALFQAGAGRWGEYEKCCWSVKGEGQFLPTLKADPFCGVKGQVSRVEEYRIEVLCQAGHLKGALSQMIEAHPYEEPAYFVFESHPLKKG